MCKTTKKTRLYISLDKVVGKKYAEIIVNIEVIHPFDIPTPIHYTFIIFFLIK